MARRSLIFVLSALVVSASAAFAQDAMLIDKHDITPYAARKLIDACFAQAASGGFPIALAVTDSAGYLVSYEATTPEMRHTGVTAQLKAKTAAKFRRSTAELYDRTNKNINRAAEWMGYFPVPGGYPIVVNDEVVGAMGAGSAGLSGGKDEGCVENAIKSVFGDGKSAPPASEQAVLFTRKTMTPKAARALVDACAAYAGEKKYTALGISVVDPDGTLLSFQGTEGALASALDTAQLKATTAAHWQRPTEELWDRVNNQVNRAPEFIGDFAQPGGFPIWIGKDMIGAIGAGGALGKQDDECAKAAIKAVFPNATVTRP
jgi:glc operon protein GlcG